MKISLQGSRSPKAVIAGGIESMKKGEQKSVKRGVKKRDAKRSAEESGLKTIKKMMRVLSMATIIRLSKMRDLTMLGITRPTLMLKYKTSRGSMTRWLARWLMVETSQRQESSLRTPIYLLLSAL